MFAIAAAVIFGLALIIDFFNIDASDAFTATTLLLAGLLCLSLHLAGVGGPARTGRTGRGWRR